MAYLDNLEDNVLVDIDALNFDETVDKRLWREKFEDWIGTMEAPTDQGLLDVDIYNLGGDDTPPIDSVITDEVIKSKGIDISKEVGRGPYGTVMREAYDRLPLPSLYRAGKIRQAGGLITKESYPAPVATNINGQFITLDIRTQFNQLGFMTSEQWKDSKYYHKDLSFPEGVYTGVAEILKERKELELARTAVMERSPKDVLHQIAYFGVGMAAEFADPLNVALMLVPIAGQAKWLGAIGKNRVVRRTVKGGIEGFVGNLAPEYVAYQQLQREQANYTLEDSMFNLVIGAGAGAGFRNAIGGVQDLSRAVKSINNILDDGWSSKSYQEKEIITMKAFSDLEQDQFITVKDIGDAQTIGKLTTDEVVKSQKVDISPTSYEGRVNFVQDTINKIKVGEEINISDAEISGDVNYTVVANELIKAKKMFPSAVVELHIGGGVDLAESTWITINGAILNPKKAITDFPVVKSYFIGDSLQLEKGFELNSKPLFDTVKENTDVELPKYPEFDITESNRYNLFHSNGDEIVDPKLRSTIINRSKDTIIFEDIPRTPKKEVFEAAGFKDITAKDEINIKKSIVEAQKWADDNNLRYNGIDKGFQDPDAPLTYDHVFTAYIDKANAPTFYARADENWDIKLEKKLAEFGVTRKKIKAVEAEKIETEIINKDSIELITELNSNIQLSKKNMKMAEGFVKEYGIDLDNKQLNNFWEFNRLVATKEQIGEGTKLIKRLVDIADEKEMVIYNTPNAYGKMKQTELIKWYEKYGFEVVDSDKPVLMMVRYPSAPIEKTSLMVSDLKSLPKAPKFDKTESDIHDLYDASGKEITDPVVRAKQIKESLDIDEEFMATFEKAPTYEVILAEQKAKAKLYVKNTEALDTTIDQYVPEEYRKKAKQYAADKENIDQKVNELKTVISRLDQEGLDARLKGLGVDTVKLKTDLEIEKIRKEKYLKLKEIDKKIPGLKEEEVVDFARKHEIGRVEDPVFELPYKVSLKEVVDSQLTIYADANKFRAVYKSDESDVIIDKVLKNLADFTRIGPVTESKIDLSAQLSKHESYIEEISKYNKTINTIKEEVEAKLVAAEKNIMALDLKESDKYNLFDDTDPDKPIEILDPLARANKIYDIEAKKLKDTFDFDVKKQKIENDFAPTKKQELVILNDEVIPFQIHNIRGNSPDLDVDAAGLAIKKIFVYSGDDIKLIDSLVKESGMADMYNYGGSVQKRLDIFNSIREELISLTEKTSKENNTNYTKAVNKLNKDYYNEKKKNGFIKIGDDGKFIPGEVRKTNKFNSVRFNEIIEDQAEKLQRFNKNKEKVLKTIGISAEDHKAYSQLIKSLPRFKKGVKVLEREAALKNRTTKKVLGDIDKDTLVKNIQARTGENADVIDIKLDEFKLETPEERILNINDAAKTLDAEENNIGTAIINNISADDVSKKVYNQDVDIDNRKILTSAELADLEIEGTPAALEKQLNEATFELYGLKEKSDLTDRQVAEIVEAQKQIYEDYARKDSDFASTIDEVVKCV